ncbi:hypothetical protein [Draconibacterium sediminis]|uniref:hypothetical protein n=1 Tax=Draconibacterium sediminis TaxID=1544798 RepID=UPI0026F1BF4A|nr:hypothetical protein [Draconibacterium sediminis]
MKKQILILILFAVAIVAGTSKSYGQEPVNLGQYVTDTMMIDPLDCIEGSLPLHPFAGVPYTYSMIDTGEVQVSQWLFWATKDTTFIDAAGLNLTDSLRLDPSQLLDHSDNYGVFSTADTVSITWSPTVLANTFYQGDNDGDPTFVVGYGIGDCNDNIQVYEINPKPSFTIDIANIDPDLMTTMPWDSVANSCVSDVYSATYNAATNSLNMDYGSDTLYFEISAANFVKNFMTYFYLEGGLEQNQEATLELYHDLALAQGGVSTDVLYTWDWDYQDIIDDTDSIMVPDTFYAAQPADIVDGVSLFLKVIISNNQYESLQDNPFTIAVDARDNDNTGIWDMEDADCDETDPAYADAPDQVDQATHIITPRPRIDDNTTDDETIIPNTVVPKGSSTGTPYHKPTYPEY